MPADNPVGQAVVPMDVSPVETVETVEPAVAALAGPPTSADAPPAVVPGEAVEQVNSCRDSGRGSGIQYVCM